ncbi:MAG: hypothetical protein K2Q01_02710 [Rickettsiales bacterium]|nr:hypothetical protein [Rickettsiales bacterium]
MQLAAAGLGPNAPVPKDAPLPQTLTALGENDPIPALGDNKAKLNAERFGDIFENRERFDSIFVIRDKNDPKIIAGVVGVRNNTVEAVLGDGVKVKLDGGTLNVVSATGKPIEIPQPNAKNATNMLLVDGATTGITQVEVAKSERWNRVKSMTGNLRVSVAEGAERVSLSVFPQAGKESAITLALPQTMLAEGSVERMNPILLMENGPGYKSGSGQTELSLGSLSDLAVFPTSYDKENVIRLQNFSLKLETQTDKGKGEIMLFENGTPTKDKEALQKALKGLKATAPGKGEGRAP